MELFDLYDDERNFTGETIERGKPLPENRYHLVIHICSASRSKKDFPTNGIFRLEEALSPVKTADRRQDVSCTRSSE